MGRHDDAPRWFLGSHANSEGERISIDTASAPPFAGRPLLMIHDDAPSEGGSGAAAPMLLDNGTRDWLLRQMLQLLSPKAVDTIDYLAAEIAIEGMWDPYNNLDEVVVLVDALAAAVGKPEVTDEQS